MNTALIFAGGSGTRMNTTGLPKQFLKVNDKPIIIHTIDFFEENPDIDAICVVCIEDYIDYFKKCLKKFNIEKVKVVVPGGKDGQESIYNGLKALHELYGDQEDTIVLIHDGVRPLINTQLISDNIACVKKHGTAITVAPASETIITVNDTKNVSGTVERSRCFLARAPQGYYLKDIYGCHLKALAENRHDFIDSASMMMNYEKKLHIIDGPSQNIKITKPEDFYIFRAILQAKENEQIMGI